MVVGTFVGYLFHPYEGFQCYVSSRFDTGLDDTLLNLPQSFQTDRLATPSVGVGNSERECFVGLLVEVPLGLVLVPRPSNYHDGTIVQTETRHCY